MENLLRQILDTTEGHKEENENHILLYYLQLALFGWVPSLLWALFLCF